MVDKVPSTQTSIDQSLVKQTGVKFQNCELKSITRNVWTHKEGKTGYESVHARAEFHDGTVVDIPLGQKYATITKDGGTYIFENLNGIEISKSDPNKSASYHLYGCDALVDTKDDVSDNILVANARTGRTSAVSVYRDNKDNVEVAGYKDIPNNNTPVHAMNRGNYLCESRKSEAKNFKESTFSTDKNVENMPKFTQRVTQYTSKGETKYYSWNDNKQSYVELDSDFVKAHTVKCSDGYTIKTSPDNKKQWFFNPDGKQISRAEFLKRGKILETATQDKKTVHLLNGKEVKTEKSTYGRTKTTDFDGNVNYVSHDGKLLKKSYVEQNK